MLHQGKKALFVILWTVGAFTFAVLTLTILSLFLPERLGEVNAETSTLTKLTYSVLPLLPFGAAAMCLLVGLRGKLPGTNNKS